jgi:anthranilate phosphoribosyltransferase
LPPLPDATDAATTARWIEQVLNGTQAVPAPIADQVEHCLQVAKHLHARHMLLDNSR